MHWLQRQWYGTTLFQLLLIPVSMVFGLLASLRRLLYRIHILTSYSVPAPVIVVGNISVGGTGKTPLTLALAQQLITHGWHPLIISRGYKSTAQQPYRVESGMSPQQSGDEPLLMAERNLCPVWVGSDRVATARAALQNHSSCDVVLSDDGLQHYRLQRDVEIAVIDGVRKFGNGRLLPAGPLREPLSRLNTVDAVVTNGGTLFAGQYAMRLDGHSFYNLIDPEIKMSSEDFRDTRNHAIAGIGHPQRFFAHLKSLGIACTPHAFADHHPYVANDLSFTECDAILMTEKDAVKCAAFADARYWVLRVDAEFDSALTDLILRKIRAHGPKTA